MKDIKIAIVSSSFRKEVSDNLEKRCLQTLQRRGVGRKQVDIFRVPGSLEIPLVFKKLAKKAKYDAIIAFGAIVKGQTYHFEQIANECIRGCMDVSWQYEIPLIFEVLAVYDLKDAVERATRKNENKGVEAALTALTMIKLIKQL
ncbi:MAG: 6,7-dimethyl-8-ribityllumazine synthase [Candidatus Doudnabacteria bacterium]|nr:6,7-dimethyl-8-ribityllumazine synthase [Candidatus Doudnabacteria bacterium]